MTVTKNCAMYSALELLSGKWTLMILRELCEEPKGFNQLMRDIEGINPRILSTRMRELVEGGLANKSVIDAKPVRVEYSLTSHGKNLRTIIEDLDTWARSAPVAS